MCHSPWLKSSQVPPPWPQAGSNRSQKMPLHLPRFEKFPIAWSPFSFMPHLRTPTYSTYTFNDPNKRPRPAPALVSIRSTRVLAHTYHHQNTTCAPFYLGLRSTGGMIYTSPTVTVSPKCRRASISRRARFSRMMREDTGSRTIPSSRRASRKAVLRPR
jgi:hypothetical protein